MLNIKSAYFYFLAIKINLIKTIKKIYFTTNFYNKTLQSKTPRQFSFYPNPFLLSSLTNYKNFSFKISNIDTDIFWTSKNARKEEENIHSFLWLNLIDRKNDKSVIQKIITIWIYKNSKYKKIIWDSSIISKRIISWIINADIILSKTDNLFKNDFYRTTVIQANHLKKNLIFENDFLKRIEIITAIILVGLVFKEYENFYLEGSRDLESLVKDYFDKDGFPLNRNPSHLLITCKYLVLIKECIKDAHKYVPDFLDDIVDKSLSCLSAIKTPKNELPLFNGATEISLEEFFKYVEGLDYKLKKNLFDVGKLKILKYKNDIIYFDFGACPKKKFSSNYQSGPLSFEYFYDKEKIISNCGFGFNISKKAELLSRFTSAQSTLCINDTSIIKFERNKIINSAFGNSTKETFKILNYEYSEKENAIKVEASHNAYSRLFGCIHNRIIKIDKKMNIFYGEDTIINDNKLIKNIPFNIRFHLYPGIRAVKTIGGDSILIQTPKNRSLVFTAKEQLMSVEKSIFLGGNKILNNLCINISGNININKKVNWEIKKDS